MGDTLDSWSVPRSNIDSEDATVDLCDEFEQV